MSHEHLNCSHASQHATRACLPKVSFHSRIETKIVGRNQVHLQRSWIAHASYSLSEPHRLQVRITFLSHARLEEKVPRSPSKGQRSTATGHTPHTWLTNQVRNRERNGANQQKDDRDVQLLPTSEQSLSARSCESNCKHPWDTTRLEWMHSPVFTIKTSPSSPKR